MQVNNPEVPSVQFKQVRLLPFLTQDPEEPVRVETEVIVLPIATVDIHGYCYRAIKSEETPIEVLRKFSDFIENTNPHLEEHHPILRRACRHRAR